MSDILKLRVLTMNVHKGFGLFNRRFVLPKLREAVRGVSADIVFLQEVIGTHEKHSIFQKDWPTTTQYEFLADSMWPDFAYGQNAVYPEGHHGNAILSKFPIIQYSNFDISIDNYERRGLLLCTLKTNFGHDIYVICVHLGLREYQRQLQLDLLFRLIDSLPPKAALIVAGDFNDWMLKAQIRLMTHTDLVEIFVNACGNPVRTFPAFLPLFRLDRIYVRNALNHYPILLPNRQWAHLSDHIPLAAEIAL